MYWHNFKTRGICMGIFDILFIFIVWPFMISKYSQDGTWIIYMGIVAFSEAGVNFLDL